jgi:hypothetical protein
MHASGWPIGLADPMIAAIARATAPASQLIAGQGFAIWRPSVNRSQILVQQGFAI